MTEVTRVGITIYDADGKRIRGWGGHCRPGTEFYRGLIAEAMVALGFFVAARVVIDVWVSAHGKTHTIVLDKKPQAQDAMQFLDCAVLSVQEAIENIEEQVH